MSQTARFPTLFIPHGGGPCFFLDPPSREPWRKMEAYLRGIDGALGRRPRAVLVISGHWECPRPTVNTAAAHTLLFDYYGFPEHTYRLTYPAPVSPQVTARVRDLLADAGIDSAEEAHRGLDHGVFVPFLLIYPDASVPVVQLSLKAGLDAAEHLAIGRALIPLREEGALIAGSGMSYHNLTAFFSKRGNEDSERFDEWLHAAATAPNEAERAEKLIAWQRAPGAAASHPHPDHLLPLMVAAGAADGDAGVRTYNDHIFGKAVSGFQFGWPESAVRAR
ncbi:MAG: dioxygenase [Bryobacterales bacterium]|nr:dioxygenase [Bryobacterales bacterium]